MSQTKDEQLASMELGTSSENDNTSVEDEPDGPPPAGRVETNAVANEERDVDVEVEEETPMKAQPPATSGNYGNEMTPYEQASLQKGTKAPGDDFDDEEEIKGPAVGGKGVQKYEDDQEKNKNRRRGLIIAAVLILLFALLLALGLIFAKDNGPTQKGLVAQTDAPTSKSVVTPAPSQSPTTKAPTPGAPTTRRPTMGNGVTQKPTGAPTAPTFGGPVTVSRLSCAELRVSEQVTAGNLGNNNFEVYTLNRGRQVCGDTFAGFDKDHPNRNQWTATIGRRDCEEFSFHEGTEICEEVGARRCTADELAQHAAQGSGCGGDNFPLWTSTTCVNEETDADGYLQINLSLKNNGTWFLCETNLADETITRCCGDIF